MALGFDQDCRHSVLDLRSALISLYRRVEADPTRPQDVARRFRLNKNLTWKVARIIQAEDPLASIPMIPGPAGVSILLGAMEDAGAPADAIEAVVRASRAFDEMVARHAGDRATLELLVDGVLSEPLEQSRKLAFRGNSGVWGLQARARITTVFHAPSATDPSRLDLALVGGFVDLCRLRPTPDWPLFHVGGYNDDQAPPPPDHRERLDDGTDQPWLLQRFCRGAVSMDIRRTSTGQAYVLGEGPVGRTGACTCVFGFRSPALVSRYRDDHNEFGEMFSTVAVPSEAIQFDVFMHRELEEASVLTPRLLGSLWGAGAPRGAPALPCAERPHDLGVGAGVSSPLMPDYPELIRMVQQRCGWDHADFRCLRFVMEFPPVPSTVVMRYRLPDAPRA